MSCPTVDTDETSGLLLGGDQCHVSLAQGSALPGGQPRGRSSGLAAQRGPGRTSKAAPQSARGSPTEAASCPPRPAPARPRGAGGAESLELAWGSCPRVGAPIRVEAEFGARLRRKGAGESVEGRRGTPTSASSNLLGLVSAPTSAVLGDPRAVGSRGPFGDSPHLFPPAFLRPQRQRANWGSGRKRVAFAGDAPPPLSDFLVFEARRLSGQTMPFRPLGSGS